MVQIILYCSAHIAHLLMHLHGGWNCAHLHASEWICTKRLTVTYPPPWLGR